MAVLQLIRDLRTALTWHRFVAGVLGLAGSTSPVLCSPRTDRQTTRSHVEWFTISQTAHLWCDIDPTESGTLETKIWCQKFYSAARRGEMKSENSSGNLLVPRETLKEFTEENGYDPEFLR